jgi:hypothetical protein
MYCNCQSQPELGTDNKKCHRHTKKLLKIIVNLCLCSDRYAYAEHTHTELMHKELTLMCASLAYAYKTYLGTIKGAQVCLIGVC